MHNLRFKSAYKGLSPRLDYAGGRLWVVESLGAN